MALFIVSCDKDYNSIGSDIVGNENFLFEKYTGPLSIKSSNQITGPVQTNGLYIHQLGVIDNSLFGGPNEVTKNHFATQLALSDFEPEIHSGVQVDSVVLTVPYFSTKLSTDSNGWGKYDLDSIYTSNTVDQEFDAIKLKVYRNGYTLNSYDPNEDFATAKKYYSDDNSKFSSNIVDNVLNNDPDVKQNDQFVPDKKEYVRFKVDGDLNMMPKTNENVQSRSNPRMRLKLDKNYFKTAILDAARDETNLGTKQFFTNNSNFRSYFKGLYFQVEQIGANYTSMMLDFAKGNVTIYYKQHKTDNDTSANPELEMKELVLNMSGQMVNLFENNVSIPSGDSRIYLKGGQGSMAFIELFSGTELQQLRDKKVLINDASLYFTVDSSLGNPNRIYLFDANNDKVLYDYSIDPTSVSTNPKINKFIFGGILYKDDQGVKKYRIRITDHIRRVLASSDYDKENVRLGLVVTESINNVSNLALKNKFTLPALPSGFVKEFDKIPSGSVVSPNGVVLFGTDSSLDPDKKVKFEIYYTKPN
ncbi:DUF4270 domain-containing protein [Flavobacterium terrae]|nr:DUF4270 domain-containing protein [Flavobacterium terrae]